MPDAGNIDQMAETFAMSDDEVFPLSPALIYKEQRKDKEIKESFEKDRQKYGVHTVEDVKLITVNDKILVPKVLRQRIVAWYHEYLVHPGQTRMEATLKQTLTWPNLRKDVELYL